MMGRLKSDQGQLFYEFHLGDAVPEDHLVKIIWYGRSTLHSICPGFVANLHLIIRRWVVHRSIRS
jgi:hypothetical protein